MSFYKFFVSSSVFSIGIFSLAQAFIITNDPSLPPVTGHYRTANDVHVEYPPLLFTVNNISHYDFTNIVRTPLGPNELEQFDSLLHATIQPGSIPVEMSGPVEVLVLNKVGNVTGLFATEVLSLNLVGGGILIRESPILASLGQTEVTNIGGGLFRIDSFFDVFTELSLDGGATWLPSDGPTRVTLVLPEPATYLVLASLLALGLFYAYQRKRKLV
ncbi:MAG: hypothetical protein Q8K75_03450 [Chlamydiales bacterium]|nr:hypothetical protein [Chlamydiales bacterium]